jgi:NitT/TauT family transport system substrate-binding protein
MFNFKKTGLIVLTAALLASCSPKEEVSEVTITVSTPVAPYSIPLLYMMEKGLMGEGITMDVKLHKSRQEAVARVVKNEVDFVNLSVQEIAHLHNQEMSLVFLDVSNWVTFRLMTTDPDVNSFEDLRGNELWVSGKGGPIDLVSMAVLSHNGLDEKSNYSLKRMGVMELAQMALNELKGIKNFVLREPFSSQVLLGNSNARVLYNLGDEWQGIHGLHIPQSGTAVAREFLDNYPKMVEKFTRNQKKAIEWTYKNPEEAAELGARYIPGMSKEILLDSIRNMNMKIESPQDAREALELYFSMFLEFNPKMIGEKLPSDDFYSGM